MRAGLCRAVSGLLLTLALAYAETAGAQVTPADTQAPAPIDETLDTPAKGHGSISIAYLNTLINGFFVSSNQNVPNGSVRSRSIDLDLDYYFADAWSVHVGLPYISNRYTGPAPHCPTTVPVQCQNNPLVPPLSPPHPESQFLDDGNFHSTWQDWSLGVAYHTNIGSYIITPSITAYIPSHNYTFFANAAVGQDLQEVELDITLAHQFDFTNLYYRVGYGYAFTEKTLGIDVNHSKLNLELGYFVNPKLSVRLFGIGKVGNGIAADGPDIFAGQTNIYWFHHDQISEHNYFGAGVGFDYEPADRYTLSASVQRLVWGETVFDFKYSAELRLTKAF